MRIWDRLRPHSTPNYCSPEAAGQEVPSDRDFGGRMHGLEQMKQLHAFTQGLLKRIVAADSPIPPARLLITAVRTASSNSFLPEAPAQAISPVRAKLDIAVV